VNETPTNIALTNSLVAENEAINTVVGVLSTADPDAGNTFTYTLVAGDIAAFNINGSDLRTSAVFNYEAQSSYTVTVRSTDQGGLWYEKVFIITVTNVNETPELAAVSDATIDELVPFTFTASATDVDAGTLLTFSLAGLGIPAGATIDPVSGIFNWTPSEVQGPAVYTFTVKVCDNGEPVLCAEDEITLTVNEVNVSPVALDDEYSITINTTLNVPAAGVLTNDTDADLPANTLTAVKITDPANGTLTLNANGSFSYTPITGWFGMDTFTYQAYDGALYSATATVTITVTPVFYYLYMPFVIR
jgi:VCBS repeat-containing protein